YEWQLNKRGEGKWTKVPYQSDGELASSTDSKTCVSFALILSAYNKGGYDGIGLVLTPNDPYTAFDFDHCLDETLMIIDSCVAAYLNAPVSYAEITPSGTGLRVMVRAKLPPNGRKKGNFEVYDVERYVTITGACFPTTAAPIAIADRQSEVEAIHAEIFV